MHFFEKKTGDRNEMYLSLNAENIDKMGTIYFLIL